MTQIDSSMPVYTQPTDPDTLKIMEKIRKEYEQEKKLSQDPNIQQHAKENFEKALQNRQTGTDRTFVGKTVEVDPQNRAVRNMASHIQTDASSIDLASRKISQQ